MRAVVQRVSSARVRVGAEVTGEIGPGLLVFASVAVDDAPDDARALAEKVAGLRVFADERGLMNRAIGECGGAILLVSQFTLHGDARRGRRPSFAASAKEPQARQLFELAGHALEGHGIRVEYGRFGARMEVELVNDGPVTILLDTKRAF